MFHLKAIVYTRPYPEFFADYCFFACPKDLMQVNDFKKHIQNVIWIDDSKKNSLVGRRWHVMRHGDYIVVGMGTTEFERYDQAGPRLIRGYYGFAMPAVEPVLPSLELFKLLDKLVVEPSFIQEEIKTIDSQVLCDGVFAESKNYIATKLSADVRFNYNNSYVQYLPLPDEDLSFPVRLLTFAIQAASENPSFELLVGIGTREHALKLPILNCVCHEVLHGEKERVPETVLQSGYKSNFSRSMAGISTESAQAQVRKSMGAKMKSTNVNDNVATRITQSMRPGFDKVEKKDMDITTHRVVRRLTIELYDNIVQTSSAWKLLTGLLPSALKMLLKNDQYQFRDEKNIDKADVTMRGDLREASDTRLRRNLLLSGIKKDG